MTKRGQKFGKVLFASMLLTLTVALGGCAGDKTAGDSTQIADTSAWQRTSYHHIKYSHVPTCTIFMFCSIL